jgi:hypothetical protein
LTNDFNVVVIAFKFDPSYFTYAFFFQFRLIKQFC